MTRRGSLAYYLASWVCGTFFMTICFVAGAKRAHSDISPISSILLFYFLALSFGAATALLFGFLLRRIALRLGFRSLWQWLVAGAIVAPSLIGFFGEIFLHTGRAAKFLLPIYLYVLYAPGLMVSQGVQSLWRMALAGIATAWVLYRVHRAFAKPSSATAEEPSTRATNNKGITNASEE